MACNSMPKVGYLGQRYLVGYFRIDDGKECTFGWTNNADGEPFVSSIKLMSNARDPFVRDLDKEPYGT